jgi:GT2 family glycosyltransferase
VIFLKKQLLSKCIYVDGFFIGWVYDSFVSNLEVSLYEDEKLITSSFANLELREQDLKEIESPPTKNCYFKLKVPSYLLDGREHKLSLKVKEWSLSSDPKFMPIDFVYGQLSGEVYLEDDKYHGFVDFKTTISKLPYIYVYENIFAKPIARVSTSFSDDIATNKKRVVFEMSKSSSSPLFFKCSGILLKDLAPTKKSNIIGKLLKVTVKNITGFIIDSANLSKILNLYLYIDGTPFAMITPDRKSYSVAKMLKVDYEDLNNSFFTIPTPKILLDDKAHKIEIIVQETGKPLDNGVQDVLFRSSNIPYLQLADLTPPKTVKNKVKWKTTDTYEVSIVILNRNGEKILEELFESFFKHNSLDVEFIIIDHASTDNSLEIIKNWSYKLAINLVALDYNDSFSASCNRGAALAQSENILFLNNDIIWVQDALVSMLEDLKDDTVGFVGMKLIKQDEGWIQETQHLGIRFTLVGNQYWPYEVAPDKIIGEAEFTAAIFPAVTGAVMLCRKADFDAIGGFSEEYYYGFEDVEICVRMRNILGKKSLCRNDLVSIHKHGYTRLSGREKSVFNRQEHNSKIISSNLGLWLKQISRESLYNGDREWQLEKLVVTFVISDMLSMDRRNVLSTLLPIAQEIEANNEHIKVTFLTPDYDWYEVSQSDVLIVCDKEYDLRLLKNKKASCCVVGYALNTAKSKEWLKTPWFWMFDLFKKVKLDSNGILSILKSLSTQLRMAILVPVHKKDSHSSDYWHIASKLCEEFRSLGVKIEPLYVEDWEDASFVVDAYIHMSVDISNLYSSRIRLDALNILWSLADIDTLDKEKIATYDLVWSTPKDISLSFESKDQDNFKDLKRYIVLESFDDVAPVLYPNVYYVSQGLTYPPDEDSCAKRVEIYTHENVKTSYKEWMLKTAQTDVYVGRFKQVADIFQNRVELLSWNSSKAKKLSPLVQKIQKTIKEKVGLTFHTS